MDLGIIPDLEDLRYRLHSGLLFLPLGYIWDPPGKATLPLAHDHLNYQTHHIL